MKKKFNDIFSILVTAEKKIFSRLIVLDLVISLLDIFFLIALLYVVGFYTGTYKTSNIFYIDVSFLEKNPLFLISLFFLLFSLKNILAYYVGRLQFRFVYKVASRISRDSLAHYLESDYMDYVTIDSAVHIRRISQQPVEFAHYILRGVQLIISNMMLLFLALVPLFVFNATLAGLLFIVLTPPVLLAAVLAKRKLKAIRAANNMNREKSIQHLQEALEGFIEINVYQQKKFFTDRYADYQEKFNRSLAELQVVQTIPSKLMEIFAVFGLFALVTATTLFNFHGSLHILLIGGFMAAAYKIIPGAVKILNSWEQIKTYTFTIDDLKKNNSSRKTGNHHSPTIIESISGKDLGFAYNGKPILKDFSFELKKGDFAGLKGASGAGKTSLINILLGFLEPSSGEIRMNGQRADRNKRTDCWSSLSYARQQPFFMHETILSNILLSTPVIQEKLDELLFVTGVDKIAGVNRDCKESLLTEKAKNISGGQKQRIILARTLYKEADLYILDEPFNELDKESASRLLTHLQKMAARGKMILMVTHDSHSLSFCNKVISLDES